MVEEPNDNSEGLKTKRRTFELYKLKDRWAAANGPTARVPHYMYTFGPDANAKIHFMDKKPGVFSLIGGGTRYMTGTSAIDLQKFGTFSVAVEGDDDENTYTKERHDTMGTSNTSNSSRKTTQSHIHSWHPGSDRSSYNPRDPTHTSEF